MVETIHSAPTTRRERKHAALRARIVATAIELFARHGFDRVTVDHIADVADIGKGTVYNYFQTKEDIVVAYMVELECKVQSRVSQLAASKKPVQTILEEFIRLQFRLKTPYHKFVRVFLAQMFARTAEFFPYMVEMQKIIDPPLVTLFQSLHARKLIRADLEISTLIQVFKTIHLGINAVWAHEGPPFRGTQHILKQEIKLFCEGLKRRS